MTPFSWVLVDTWVAWANLQDPRQSDLIGQSKSQAQAQSQCGEGLYTSKDSEKGDLLGVAIVMIYPNSLCHISEIYNCGFTES